jgi:hypothetical protein
MKFGNVFGKGSSLVWIAALAGSVFMTPTDARGQTANLRLNLQVKNVDLGDSCASPGFRPEFKITNFGTQPFVLTQATIRLFFNNPQQQPIEFVNADFVRIFNPNGQLTGTFAQAFEFQGPPPPAVCVATPARTANQRRFIAFQPIPGQGLVTIPPNGGFATVVVQFRRAGGLSPFDVNCDDASKLQNQNPARPFFDDAFFSLVANAPMGPPTQTLCEFTSATAQDPLTGLDICTNTTGCAN